MPGRDDDYTSKLKKVKTPGLNEAAGSEKLVRLGGKSRPSSESKPEEHTAVPRPEKKMPSQKNDKTANSFLGKYGSDFSQMAASRPQSKPQEPAVETKTLSFDRGAAKKVGKKTKNKKKSVNKKDKSAAKPAKPQRITNIADVKRNAPAPRPVRTPQKTEPSKKGKIFRVAGITTFFVVIAILIGIAIFGPHMNSGIQKSYIQSGTLEKSYDGTAVYLRDEIVVSTEYAGKLMANVNEGERVAKGAIVAYVVDDSMYEILEELKKVESRILSAENYNDSMIVSVSENLGKIDDSITESLIALSSSSINGELRSYGEIRTELDDLYELRNDIAMNVDSKDAYINSLQTKRDSLLADLDGHMHPLTAPEAGVVSYCLDGKESVVTSMDYQNITADSLQGLDANASLKVGQDVQAGENVLRITANNDYYIAVRFSGDVSDGIKRDSQVTVKSDSRNFMTTAVVQSVSTSEDETVVVLKSSSNLAAAISYRTQHVSVIFESVSGLKVPLKALTDWDTAGVSARIALIRSNYVEYVYVNVLSKSDEYAIISNKTNFDDGSDVKAVQINDLYVVNPEKVTEGEILE